MVSSRALRKWRWWKGSSCSSSSYITILENTRKSTSIRKGIQATSRLNILKYCWVWYEASPGCLATGDLSLNVVYLLRTLHLVSSPTHNSNSDFSSFLSVVFLHTFPIFLRQVIAVFDILLLLPAAVTCKARELSLVTSHAPTVWRHWRHISPAPRSPRMRREH